MAKSSAPSPHPPTHSLLLAAALELARAGLRPTPMIAARKRPALKGWRDAASCDPDAVREVFSRAKSADGLATGAGRFVVDLDRSHSDGADGIASFAALVRQHNGVIAKGPRVRTPRRGVHLYFASPPNVIVANRVALAPGVDVRGDGGLAMAPPSCCNGASYCWAPSPFDIALPPAPDWLVALVTRRPKHEPAFALLRSLHGDPSVYAGAALNAELRAAANARPGARNQTLFKAAARLGSLAAAGALSVDLVVAALLEAAEACGLMHDDGRTAVEATIASGLRRGLANPRNLDRRQP